MILVAVVGMSLSQEVLQGRTGRSAGVETAGSRQNRGGPALTPPEGQGGFLSASRLCDGRRWLRQVGSGGGRSRWRRSRWRSGRRRDFWGRRGLRGAPREGVDRSSYGCRGCENGRYSCKCWQGRHLISLSAKPLLPRPVATPLSSPPRIPSLPP